MTANSPHEVNKICGFRIEPNMFDTCLILENFILRISATISASTLDHTFHDEAESTSFNKILG